MKTPSNESGETGANVVMVLAVVFGANVGAVYIPAYGQLLDIRSALRTSGQEAYREFDDEKVRKYAIDQIHRVAPDIEYDEHDGLTITRVPNVSIEFSIDYTKLLTFPVTHSQRTGHFHTGIKYDISAVKW